MSLIGLVTLAAVVSRGEVSNPFFQRLLAQVTDVNPQWHGSNPAKDNEYITPTVAWDKKRFNPLRIIRVTQTEGVFLIGASDPEVVGKLLGKDVKPVVQDFGNGVRGVPTYIMTTKNVGQVGCSCPPIFEEFSVNVMIENPGLEDASTITPATMHFAPLYLTTNHLKRQETLVHKFMMPEQFAGIPKKAGGESHIGFLQSAVGVNGIYLKNQAGQVVFRANRTKNIVPRAGTAVPMLDLVMYSLKDQVFNFEGDKTYDLFNLDNFRQSGQYFRVQEPNHLMGFDPTKAPPESAFFSPSDDSLFVDSKSEIGALLGQISYKPLVWTSDQLNQAIVWSPRPLQTY